MNQGDTSPEAISVLGGETRVFPTLLPGVASPLALPATSPLPQDCRWGRFESPLSHAQPDSRIHPCYTESPLGSQEAKRVDQSLAPPTYQIRQVSGSMLHFAGYKWWKKDLHTCWLGWITFRHAVEMGGVRRTRPTKALRRCTVSSRLVRRLVGRSLGSRLVDQLRGLAKSQRYNQT